MEKIRSIGNFSLIIIIAFWSSCNSPDQARYVMDSDFSTWIGFWQYEFEGRKTIETWDSIAGNQFSGLGMNISPTGDTTFQENLSLILSDSGWVYQASIATQNQGRTISFMLDSIDEGYWRFVNTHHDFPQVITYYLPASDTLETEVAGILGDERQSRKIRLVRK